MTGGSSLGLQYEALLSRLLSRVRYAVRYAGKDGSQPERKNPAEKVG